MTCTNWLFGVLQLKVKTILKNVDDATVNSGNLRMIEWIK